MPSNIERPYSRAETTPFRAGAGIRTRVDSGSSFREPIYRESAIAPSYVPNTYVPNYSRVSSFRSPEMEVLLYSPEVSSMEIAAWPGRTRVVPAYAEQDIVTGKVLLNRSCRAGRLTLTLSGTFTSIPGVKNVDKLVSNSAPAQKKRLFFSTSKVIDVISESRGSTLLRQSRAVEAETRTFPFAFDLGKCQKPGHLLPASFCSSLAASMVTEVSYELCVYWEPSKATLPIAQLSIPFLLQREPEFQSENAPPPNSWIEIPLKSHRPVPVKCAVTLPTSLNFSRSSNIPFFVVFTTSPRSSHLAREIATDATVSVTLTSEFFCADDPGLAGPSMAPTHARDSSSGTEPGTFQSESSSMMSGADSRSSRFIKRIRSSASLFSSSNSSYSTAESQTSTMMSTKTKTRSRMGSAKGPVRVSKPLPPIPDGPDTQPTTMYNAISIGFPKRPRHRLSEGKAHPSLDAQRSLPDGLFKDKIPLAADMLPSFNWGGVSLKYFFEVSVLVGQDELQAKILLRIT
ncbi:unnamed protein product [Mycena citricolor]|uniref:Uncharacterized protein n=1 Tax=Mycena citricolor TaxID=2018698 RepID=A0AAD2HX45_9AGAR|nr:unnamed protein product [Mycena citricolor]CAK5282929.1 unnamed protein product [Mycena citricolor]